MTMQIFSDLFTIPRKFNIISNMSSPFQWKIEKYKEQFDSNMYYTYTKTKCYVTILSPQNNIQIFMHIKANLGNKFKFGKKYTF